MTDGQLDGQGDASGAVSVVSTAAFAGAPQAVAQVRAQRCSAVQYSKKDLSFNLISS